MTALEDDPLAIVLGLGDGGALEAEGLEALAAGEDVSDLGEAVLWDGGVCEDEGAEVGERGRDGGRDGPDGVRGEVDVLETAEEGEVGEGRDRVVREVEGVELVARDSQVLNRCAGGSVPGC